MFYCEYGKHMTSEGQRCNRVVAEKREKEYVEKQYDQRGREVGQRRYNGWEIAREAWCCDAHVPQ